MLRWGARKGRSAEAGAARQSRDLKELLARPRFQATAGAGLLLALNLFICRELFVTEYTRHMGSIEAAYIGLSRYILEHPFSLDWFPLWYTGVPYQNTYPPLLHLIVAGFAGLSGTSPALAYHAVSAAFYVLGPVSLFWCAGLLSKDWWASFAAALGYSLFSPSLLLLPELRGYFGGIGSSARLDALIQYGEGPHVTSLTLLPLALIALHRALEKATAVRVYLAALALAAVVLTNWLGAFALAVAVVSYLLVRMGENGGLRSPATAAGIGILAYALAATWIPPSTLRAISYNAQFVVGKYELRPLHAVYGAIALALVGLVAWGLRRSAVPLIGRCGIVMALLLGAVVLSDAWFGFPLMPQARRYHLEFEMALWLAMAFGLKPLASRLPKRVWLVLPTAMVVLVAVQIANYRGQAKGLIEPIDITETVEYQAATFFNTELPGQRVYASGSSSFWLTAFADNPEIRGGFAQGIVNRQIPMVDFGITYTEGNGEDTATWLRLFDVQAVLVGGAETRDAFHNWQDPAKFDGILDELWREGDDVIYAVPQRTASLAHVIEPEDVIERTPINFLDMEPVRPLAEALENPELPLAEFEWVSTSEASISAEMAPGQLFYVQIAYHPGWRALRDGLSAPIRQDPLGMMVVEPRCLGTCEVTLIYDGGREMLLAWGATWTAIIGGLIWWGLERSNRMRSFT